MTDAKKENTSSSPFPGDTKNRILDVAERLFAKQGFDATGIDQIAREVGITKSVIYYHFKNKDALLDGVFERARTYFIAEKRGSFVSVLGSSGSLAERLKVAMDQPEICERFKPLFRIMLMETMKPNDREALFDLWDRNIELVVRMFGEFLAPDLRDDVEQFRLETFFLYFMAVIGLMVLEDSWGKRYGIPAREVRARMLTAFVRMFEDYGVSRIWGDGLERIREMMNSPQNNPE